MSPNRSSFHFPKILFPSDFVTSPAIWLIFPRSLLFFTNRLSLQFILFHRFFPFKIFSLQYPACGPVTSLLDFVPILSSFPYCPGYPVPRFPSSRWRACIYFQFELAHLTTVFRRAFRGASATCRLAFKPRVTKLCSSQVAGFSFAANLLRCRPNLTFRISL